MKKLILYLNNLDSLKITTEDDFGFDENLSLMAVSIFPDDQGNNFNFLGVLNVEEIDKFLAEHTGVRVILVISEGYASYCNVQMPTKQKRQVQKALPYLIEDNIAVDPEDCFIALGHFEGQNLTCAVMDEKLPVVLQTALNNKKWHCDFVCAFDNLLAEALRSSSTAGSISPSLHVNGDRLVLVCEDGSFYSCTLDLLDIYLGKFVQESDSEVVGETPAVSEILANQDELQTDDGSSSFLNQTLDVIIYKRNNDDDLSDLKLEISTVIDSYKKENGFAYDAEFSEKQVEDVYVLASKPFSERKAPEQLINFFQGEFKVKALKGASRFDLGINWKPPAILLAALILLSFVSVFIDTYRYKRAAEKADLRTQEIFQEIFPQSRNFTRMRNRVSALLTGGSDTGDDQFLSLLVMFSAALQVINDQNPDAINIQRLQFEQSSGDLKVDVLALDFQTLNSLKEEAGKHGLAVEISSTSNESSGIKGRLKVISL